MHPTVLEQQPELRHQTHLQQLAQTFPINALKLLLIPHQQILPLIALQNPLQRQTPTKVQPRRGPHRLIAKPLRNAIGQGRYSGVDCGWEAEGELEGEGAVFDWGARVGQDYTGVLHCQGFGQEV
jgi:hypothetical protein